MTSSEYEIFAENAMAGATSVPGELLVGFLGTKLRTLQAAVDEIKAKFLPNADVSLYSPRMLDPTKLELICSTSRHAKREIVEDGTPTQPSVIYDVSPAENCRLVLTITPRHSVRLSPVFEAILAAKLREITYNKRQRLRHLVIDKSAKSKDVNSFLHRVLNTIQSEFLFSEEMSAFLQEEHLQRLVLSATTISNKYLGSPEQGRIEKKSIYYSLHETGNTVNTFVNCRSQIEDQATGFKREEFDADIYGTKFHNLRTRAYWPIGLTDTELEANPSRKIPPLGVLRISNPERRDAHGRWPTQFTSYDSYFVAFLCEVIFVLVQQYIQFLESRTDYARLTHSIGINIEAAKKYFDFLREFLFNADTEGHNPSAKFSLPSDSVITVDRVYISMTDLGYFLDDLQFQFNKVSGLLSEVSLEAIENLHSDVLMPAVRLLPAIAAVNSKSTVPLISNLLERGSRNLKAVQGSKKALITVFRNLLENSVKYSKSNQRCKIDLQFSDTPTHVVIDYFDNGIGIAKNDLPRVFVEGFRSVQARRLSNRGIGVGLSFSKEVMTSMGGELEALEHVDGAHFRLKLRKAK